MATVWRYNTIRYLYIRAVNKVTMIGSKSQNESKIPFVYTQQLVNELKSTSSMHFLYTLGISSRSTVMAEQNMSLLHSFFAFSKSMKPFPSSGAGQTPFC